MIHDYNQKMGGVNKNDAIVGNCSWIRKTYKSHSQKRAIFRFDKSAKNVKNNGPKSEKNIFSLLNLSKQLQENVGLQYKIIT